MKTPTLMILLFVTSLSSNLNAADEQFCDNYTQTSIKQQLANIVYDCKQTGLRWSPLYKGQKAWCMTVRETVASAETTARATALTSCGANTQKLKWKELPDAPFVWDRLFGQMLQATKIDDVKAVKVMHAHGVSIHHQQDFNNGAMLYHAVDHQAEQVAEYLLEQGASPQVTTNGGGNALIKILEDPIINYRMLTMLLEKGFDPNYAGESYSFDAIPLLFAANQNNYRAVDLMLNAGGNPNVMLDFAPLFFAINQKNMSMVKRLVGAGANVNMQVGMSACDYPLNLAYRAGSLSLIEYLKSKGASLKPGC